jgi:acyl carrier protein
LIVVAEVQRARRKDWSDVIQSIRHDIAAEHDVPPDGIVLVRFGSIPKTSSGKIQRHACRDNFKNESLKTIASWYAWENADHVSMPTPKVRANVATGKENPALVELVMSQIREVGRERAKDLTLETNIVSDLGLDSLERLQIANGIEEFFGKRFPEEVLQDIDTVAAVVKAVRENFGDISQRLGTLSESAVTLSSYRSEIPASDYDFAQMPEYRRLLKTKKIVGVHRPSKPVL